MFWETGAIDNRLGETSTPSNNQYTLTINTIIPTVKNLEDPRNPRRGHARGSAQTFLGMIINLH